MDKLEYLAVMFNRRTKNKKYENMIVNAIYNGVGNEELIPVTQQYVKVHDTKERKYHLLDLYFPQLNFGVEIDESQHENEENVVADKIREEHIIEAIHCEEYRVAVTENFELLPYEEVMKNVRTVIEIIKDRIAKYEKEHGKLKWVSNDEKKQLVLSKRCFTVGDDVDFSGPTEIYNMVTGKDIKNLNRCFVSLGPSYYLWVPILFEGDENDKMKSEKWTNMLLDKRRIIEEIDETNKHNGKTGEYKDDGKKRLVFMRMRDEFGVPCIRFIGVFRATKQKMEGKKCHRFYEREDVQTISFDELLR